MKLLIIYVGKNISHQTCCLYAQFITSLPEAKVQLAPPTPHKKINWCLTDINWYLTNTENQFYKDRLYRLYKCQFVLVIFVKYWFTQISTLMIFNQYLTDTNWYILETNIIGKIGKYQLNISLFHFLS